MHSRRTQSVAQQAAADWSIRSIGAHPPGTGKAAGALLRAAFAGLLLAALVLAGGCVKTPPEAALRATIEAMQAAAESRDADALADAVSEEFVGPDGMDRDQFRRTLAVAWLRDRNVGVQLGPLDVELVGDRARVEFTAGTRGGEGWLPDRGQLYQVKTAWRLEGGDWKLISATWAPVL